MDGIETLRCEVLYRKWKSLISEDQYDSTGLATIREHVATAECLATGSGGPQDFAQSRKVARFHFLSLMGHELDHASPAALAVTGILPPAQETAVEQAYFARNVLGHDNWVEFAGRAVPSRDELLKHIEVTSVARLQARSQAWIDLGKSVHDVESELIAWLDYYDILRVDLVGSAGKGASGSGQGTQGTGFAVTSQGHVVTNSHVVQACKAIEVGREHRPAELISVDVVNDLALLKAEMKPVPLPVTVERLRLGSPISVMGYPLSGISGGQLVATTGVVSALAGLGGDSRHFQFSAPIQPGSSGGPVIDEEGNVVGVAVSTANAKAVHDVSGALPQNMNYAIRSSILQTFLSNHVDLDAGSRSLRADGMDDVINKASKSTYEIRCVQ